MSTRADQRKFHYIYKITRTDGSGRYYIGLHSTDDLDDGYFGSGQVLWKSIKKHGKAKHIMQILEFLPSRKAVKHRERELVNETLLKDPACMNLSLGGQCRDMLSLEERARISKAQRGRKLTEAHKLKLSAAALAMSEETKKKIAAGGKRRFSSQASRQVHGQKIRSAMGEETKQKMSASAKKVNTEEFRIAKSIALKTFNAALTQDERKARALHLKLKFAPGSQAAKDRAAKIQASIKRNKELKNEATN